MRTRIPAATALLALLAAAATTVACERRADAVAEPAEQRLTLMLETPETLTWGGTGVLRVTLANEGDGVAEGAIIEVHVPDWLEFGTVEPAGMEVRVVAGNGETRLTYALPDSLQPGDRRTVLQHLRVSMQGPPAAPADTVETIPVAPLNQVVRARLLTLAGEPAGAEMQSTLNFGTPVGPPPVPFDTMAGRPLPGDTTAPRDTTRRAPRDTARTRGL